MRARMGGSINQILLLSSWKFVIWTIWYIWPSLVGKKRWKLLLKRSKIKCVSCLGRDEACHFIFQGILFYHSLTKLYKQCTLQLCCIYDLSASQLKSNFRRKDSFRTGYYTTGRTNFSKLCTHTLRKDLYSYIGMFKKAFHIFPNARVTSNKTAHNIRHYFQAKFFMLSHMVWSILLGVLALKTFKWKFLTGS